MDLRTRVVQITDSTVLGEAELFRRIEAVSRLPSDSRERYAVMLRDPGLSGAELLRLGTRLREATTAMGSALWINDRVDLAIHLRAEVLHLGHLSMRVGDAHAILDSRALTHLSVGCHSVDEVGEASRAGADLAVVSPIFASPGKGEPLGLGAIASARSRASGSVRLVALGGLDLEKATACLSVGAEAVASIRADLTALLSG